MTKVYHNPHYVSSHPLYHARIDCTIHELQSITNTAMDLASLVEIQSKTILCDGPVQIYRIDLVLGELKDCEWFLLKYPECKIFEMLTCDNE